MLISILTPVYNRVDLIERLYHSLLEQTSFDFEWLIIDDGSTDSLFDMKDNFLSAPFEVRYFHKENGGKHTALNLGIDNAVGEWVLIVDSDDFLTENAIEKISSKCSNMDSPADGLIFLKASTNLEIVGNAFTVPGTKMHAEDLVTMKGDKAYVIRREVFKENKFPVYNAEKFVTESFIWNRIFDSGKSYAVGYNEVIYICEYLPGGLTDNYLSLLERNPQGTIEFVKSNLNLSSVSLNIIKQAAYHFSPVFNLKNMLLLRQEVNALVFIKFALISLLMKIKLSMVGK